MALAADAGAQIRILRKVFVMLGFVGVVGFHGRAQEPGFLAHGSLPDEDSRSHVSNRLVRPELGLEVRWRGRRGSVCAESPIWNEAQDICLIFNGEEFSERTSTKGIERSLGNGSYLVSLYEAHGPRFAERLNGWFSGLVVDLRKAEVVLFNDRYALERVYVYEKGDALYFSSEAKALLKILPELRHLDDRGLGELISVGCVLQNRTLFHRMGALPGGSCWSFDWKGGLRRNTYFDLRQWEHLEEFGLSEYQERLTETFPKVVRRYLGGGDDVAMSLTGGLDGRMIMAWAGRSPRQLRCYTFRGPFRECVDSRLARQVATLCGQSHEEIRVGPEFLTQFATLAEEAVYVSDGSMDVTGAVELYVNRLAREIAPVRLTGNYGSEVMRLGVAFGPLRIREDIFQPELPGWIRAARETYAKERTGDTLSFILSKQVPWHHYARFSVERSEIIVRSPYLDNELIELLYRAPAKLRASSQLLLRLIANGNEALARIPTDRGLVYRPVPLLSNIRRLWQEATFKAEYVYDYGMPQGLAAVDGRLRWLHAERLFLGRHKFYHFRLWYRDALARYVEDVLLDPRTLKRPYLNADQVEKTVLSHTRGEGNFTREIHRMLTLELTQRTLIEAWPGNKDG